MAPALDASRLVILIPQWHGFADGPYLRLVGGDVSTRDKLVPPDVFLASLSRKIYERSREMLRWDDRWLRQLIPSHLYLTEIECTNPDDCLIRLLRIHFINCFLLYSAEWSRAIDQTVVASYVSSQGSTEIPLRAITCRDDVKLEENGIAALWKLFQWLYSSAESTIYEPVERLQLLQITMYRILRMMDRDERLMGLINRAATILSDVETQLKVFTENKVEAFLGKEQELEELTSHTVQTFNDQMSMMISSLSGSALAAVAALVGYFLAALFKDEFNATVFRIGMFTYAGYVAIFPLAINMFNHCRQYHSAVDSFEQRQQRIAEFLTKERVERIVGQTIFDAQQTYEKWFRRIVAVYLIIIVVVALMAILLPGTISSGSNIGTPTQPPTTPASP